MQKCIGLLSVLLCITAIFMAGCTGTGQATATPTATPTPQVVYVTVYITPTPEITPEIPVITSQETISPLDEQIRMDEAFIDHINENNILDGMKTLMSASPGSYSVSTGYNAGAKNEALRLSNLIRDGPQPGSVKVKTFRTTMLDALELMDGSTAGFTRYRDAMQEVILEENAVLSEMYSQGSSLVNAQYLSGSGNDIRAVNITESGQKTFSMRYTGEHNFAVTLKDENGKYIALLANEIGDFSGKKSVTLTAGDYFLYITADGDWTIGVASG